MKGSSADHDAGQTPARPRRRKFRARPAGSFEAAERPTRKVQPIGRRSAQLYDPLTGRKLPRP